MPHVCKGSGPFQSCSLGMVNSVITSPEIFYLIIRKTPQNLCTHLNTSINSPGTIWPYPWHQDLHKKPESETPDLSSVELDALTHPQQE